MLSSMLIDGVCFPEVNLSPWLADKRKEEEDQGPVHTGLIEQYSSSVIDIEY